MATDPSPAIARRRLRLALRRAREAGGLTQGQLAEGLDWSLSKVQRIESGEVGISPSDTRSLLTYLGVADPPTVSRLVDEARAARKRGWWSEAKYKDHLTPGTIKLLQFESEARFIRIFQPTVVPGILQTRTTAESIFEAVQQLLTEDARTTRLEVRMQRRQHVFYQESPPTYLLALDESALLRQIGGTRTVIEQLNALLMDVDNGLINLRILPFTATPHVLLGPFTLLEMEEEEVLYREGWGDDVMIFDAQAITRFRLGFEQIWAACLPAEASIRLIKARVATLQASLDYHPT